MHQKIVAFLFESLKAFVLAKKLGEVYFSPLPVHLWPGKYREPDVIFVRADNAKALRGEYLEGADLVMEVVSADDPERDWVKKREEYARAGIAEYWVVDPQAGKLSVFVLQAGAYAVHVELGKDGEATSALLPGFRVRVAEALSV
jgi:Uma2 family endonuclease